MKPILKKLFKVALAGVALLAVSATLTPTTAQAGPADDLVAIYLGSLLNGTGTNIGALTTQQQANALVAGRNAFRSTVNKTQPLPVGASIPGGNVQSDQFQALLLQATDLALSNPTTLTIPRTSVALNNGRSVNVSASLTPARATASQIVSFTARRLPNYTPLLSNQGTTAALSNNGGPGNPVFNYRGRTADAIVLAQVRDAAKLATANLRAGIKTYPRGTVNVPATGLADFRNLSNQAALTRWTAAISAQAISALPDDIDISGSSVIYDRAASIMVNSLVKAANSLQRLNANAVTSIGIGAVYAAAGDSNSLWNDSNNQTVTAALNGIAFGAVTAAKRLAPSIAFGLAASFAATFTANGGDVTTFDQTANRTAIYNVIQFALKKVSPTLQTQIIAEINNGFTQGLNTLTIPNIIGSAGLNGFVYNSSVPQPVTDIVGL